MKTQEWLVVLRVTATKRSEAEELAAEALNAGVEPDATIPATNAAFSQLEKLIENATIESAEFAEYFNPRASETIQISSAPPSGAYARLRCYDNGGASIDRYTVVYMEHREPNKLYCCLAMNAIPTDPQGFCQHSECVLGKHLGKRIPFLSLPKECRDVVIHDLRVTASILSTALQAN